MTPDERNLADLRLGQRAVASAEAFPDRPFPAEVSYIAPTIDALRGTVEVKLRVPTPPPYLRPSMTVSVEVEVARRANVLTLPPDAVRDAATPAPWVMVVGNDDRTARRARHPRAARRARGRGGLAGSRERERWCPSSVGATVRVGQRVRPRSVAAAR
jgi:HlyD family secretion protein